MSEQATSTQIRALLLTDVVDSTALSERLGDAAMAEVWRQHDRVARDLLPRWQGREIDKTDGMLLMFDSAANALHYALAYHRAIAGLSTPLKARAGLHLGPVLLRENSAQDVQRGAKPLEVDGLAKPTAARIMALANGGQTLLSPEARVGVAVDELAEGLALASQGHWVLKGVSEPMELFELVSPGVMLATPTDGDKAYRVARRGERWLPVREIPNNLPQQASMFVGREQELRDIKALLGSARLVTLLGMGGLGKTRLSLQAAAELMHLFPDGVWFLDLAPISDPQLALAEVAQVLELREEPDRSLLQSVCAHLKDKRTLLIFDNCEHLVKAAAQLAHAVIKACPHVRLAASSREALRIPGEQAYPILPLPIPKPGDDLATLQRSAAVRLFVDRVQAHKPGFVLDEEQAPAVAELVARLEGIPLALELAAARLRALSLQDINRRLHDRYKILTGGSRVLQERQQTLRALVDWSYDSLPEPEQTLFQRLAPFKGGFSLAAAEAVCSAEPLDPLDLLDLITQLVEKSLLLMSAGAEGTRYRMLETLRDYASEKLGQSGAAEALGAAHCHYFFAFAKQGRDGLRGPQQGEWLHRLDTEQDNLRAAITFAQADNGVIDPIVGVKLAVALQGFWILRGYTSEGRSTMAALLQLPALQTDDWMRGHALYVSAALAVSQSDHVAAERDLQTCLALRRGLADKPFDVASTLSTLAMAKLAAGEADAAMVANLEALDIFRQCEKPVGEAIALLQLGQIDLWRGHDDAALEFLQQALDLARQLRHPETEAEAELGLAQLALETGEREHAAQGLARSLTICLAAADRRGTANALALLARLDLMEGRSSEAMPRLAESLIAFNAFDMREQLLASLEDHAWLAQGQAQTEPALALACAAQALRERAGLVRSERAQARWLGLLESMSKAAPEPTKHPAWLSAMDWDTASAVKAALRLSQPPGHMH
ncbi:ATP-binding protein [Paucibacter soli]|uniref:ATP-binding protein n=1 Tax=Paucibacter soli TaxID=3133433 RepID=UPI00309A7D3C